MVRAVTAGPITIAAYRLCIAVPLTWALARVSGSALTRRALKVSFVPAVFFMVTILAGFASFQKTSIANATLIPALQPVLVLLVAGRMFGERVGRRDLALGGASLVGIAMVVLAAGGTGGASFVGDLLAVVNLIGFTAYFLAVKQRRNDGGIEATALLAGVMLWGAVLVTPVAFLSSEDLGTIGGWDWFWLMLMVLVPGTIGHGLVNWAQRYVDVTISSLMLLASPVVSTLGAWMFYDQSLNKVQVAGAALVLASLAGIVVGRRSEVVVAEPVE
jgi:drug/metabolite transporter (DMT)-like permease